MNEFISLLAQFFAVIIVIMFHEFAHAYAAYKCGDPTAKFAGRMTLNPVKSFDLVGLLMFTLTGFGWAKPVPINPHNFDNYKKGCFWTSVAGVLMNYIMAFIFYAVFTLTLYYVLPVFSGKYLAVFLFKFTYSLFAYSLAFCAFNLLPLYPLDGFRILDATCKRRAKTYYFLKRYGPYILLALTFLHFIANRIQVLAYIDLLGYVMRFAINVLGKPITLFWNWIFQFIF